MLVDTFGNKKSKQILRQRENARIDTNTIIGGKSMETILKLKGQNGPDLSQVVMKRPKKTKKSTKESSENASAPKLKQGKQE